ncbi:MAG: efflux RND transporter permease subunit, partial [Alphaproteobacteria bacterium]|nr:efflux RND transporter permease subunit [Alphaproteobacteria bacterium]
IRPIVMSTLTSFFGMLPLVLIPGAGSELYRGLGSVVVGGLALSAILTLAIIPPLLTLLGFVILIGIVVNNAILLVHQTLFHIRSDGMAVADAIVEATRNRIRPIFMSTLTSVFGMMPLVLIPGAGSELYRGLGSVVVGGLALSAILTLAIIPPLLTLVAGTVEAGRKHRAALKEAPAE